MKKAWLAMLVAASHLQVTAHAQDAYWQELGRGWFWYAQPVPQPEPQLQPLQAQPPAAEAKPLTDLSDAPELARHKALQRRLENSRVIAIMNPSQANLSRYLYIQREVMERATTFADVWQRVVWADPQLDYGARNRPTNAVAVRAWDDQQRQFQAGLVANAAADHGLFYVFGDDCLHCDQMAGMLGRFSARHGMEVQAVAVDGASHPAFPDAWTDNGFAAASGASGLPVLLLARLSAGQEQVTPVAYGPLADVELEERIAVLTGMPVGTRF